MDDVKIAIILPETKLGYKYSPEEIKKFRDVFDGINPFDSILNLIYKDTKKYHILLLSSITIRHARLFDIATEIDDKINMLCSGQVNSTGKLHNITKSEMAEPIININDITKGKISMTLCLFELLVGVTIYSNAELLVHRETNISHGVNTAFALEYNEKAKKIIEELRKYNVVGKELYEKR